MQTPKIIVLVLCSCVNLFTSSSHSLQAPFYPAEAEKKGVSATVYGFIYASFEIVAFFSSPLFGKVVNHVGAKSMMGFGLAINGIMVTIFGFLDKCDNTVIFVLLSFTLRMMESLGATSALVASYALCGSVFKDNMASKLATLEMFYGFGVVIGPSLGGILFQIGGFYLPFASTGLICIVVAFLIFISIHEIPNDEQDKLSDGVMKALKTTSILVSLSVGAVLTFNDYFYLATLEPFLRSTYGISIFMTSFIIGGMGLLYAVFSFAFGQIIDKWVKAKWMVIMALVLCIVSSTLIGPLPFLSIPKTLATSILGLYLNELGSSAIYVSGYMHTIEVARAAGFTQNCQGFIIGIWLSAFSLGSFLGPSASGILYDLVGFPMGTLLLVIINIIMLIVFFSYFIIYKRDNTQRCNEISLDEAYKINSPSHPVYS